MDGSGTLTLAGSGDNYFLALVVDDGTVILDKASSSSPNVHAIGGGLTINSGGTVQLSGTGASQIWTAPVAITAGGTLDLDGNSDSIDGLPGAGTVTNALACSAGHTHRRLEQRLDHVQWHARGRQRRLN